MLKKEMPVKVSVVTLRKKLAEQIPIRVELREDEYEVVGWFSSRHIGWRNGTGCAVLVFSNSLNDYAYVAGRHQQGKVLTRFDEIVEEHIYIT